MSRGGAGRQRHRAGSTKVTAPVHGAKVGERASFSQRPHLRLALPLAAGGDCHDWNRDDPRVDRSQSNDLKCSAGGYPSRPVAARPANLASLSSNGRGA
jgi:hypothetical protein